MKKRQFIEREQRKQKRGKEYQIPATQHFITSFVLSPPKRKKFRFIIRHGIFLKNIPNLFACCLCCLTTKILLIRDVLKVLCMATWSQLLWGYTNRRNKFLPLREKGCNTFSLVMILQHQQIYSNTELACLSLPMVFI